MSGPAHLPEHLPSLTEDGGLGLVQALAQPGGRAC